MQDRAWRFTARRTSRSVSALAKRAKFRELVHALMYAKRDSASTTSSRIFYIVKRGLTWGFSSRNATQVSLSEKCRLPWSAVFKPPAVGLISMKIWS